MEEVVEAAVPALLAQLGWQEKFVATPLLGGANNRVFRIDAGGNRAVLKVYFQHPQDTRDRMGAEFSFGSLLWNSGVRALPKPLVKDPNKAVALYEFVRGESFVGVEVSRAMVLQAIEFFERINRTRAVPAAMDLPAASEAHFTVDGHIHGVEQRVQRLLSLGVQTDLDREAHSFVSRELKSAWHSIRGALVDFKSDVEKADKCLSPSDFGFHNALRRGFEEAVFLDFEYAGWDDPAKTIGDFFCQPKVPVPLTFFDEFCERIAACTSNPVRVWGRGRRLFPLYQIKWCCIMLNEFLPVDQKRRHFSGADGDREKHKQDQLSKARALVRTLSLGGGKV